MAQQGQSESAAKPQQPQARFLNPRRKPPGQSVSLQHRLLRHKTSSGSDENNQTDGKSNSPNSSLAINGRSSGETSNAEHWFDNSNKNVAENKASYQDDSPPFFLNKSSTTDSPPEEGTGQQISLPFRSNLYHQGSGGSSSEDYRSVIDDLTIQNKALKKRLRKYESSRPTKMSADRLFEVRIHGLSAEKKHELEETLKKFALSLENPQPSSREGTSSLDSQQRTATVGASKPDSPLSSARIADSGYGSMSTSAKASSAQSASQTKTNYRNQRPDADLVRDRTIHSYLHDIPEGLLPQHPGDLSEKSKKKLVVSRLEEIFGGRGAAPDGVHQQPLQQQEVSQSAARADRNALRAQGQKVAGEGSREANIMNLETEEPMDNGSKSQTHSDNKSSDTENGAYTEYRNGIKHVDFAAGQHSPCLEQRPTRPLDLDPYRAQIPDENFRYIRHLGFVLSRENIEKHNAREAAEADEAPWIYLNLLINLAQLHIINVTPEFVKDAVNEYSHKFELSYDGRKIRWIGDRTSSPANSHQQSTAGQASSSPASVVPGSRSSRKRSRLSNPKGRDSSHEDGFVSKKATMLKKQDNRLLYTPLFPHKYDSEDEDDHLMPDADSPAPAASPMVDDAAADTSPFPSTVKRPAPAAIVDDGPIIFYNKATFCTDLSGDRVNPVRPYKAADYQAYTTSVLGIKPPPTAVVPEDSGSRPALRPFVAEKMSSPVGQRFDDERLDDLKIKSLPAEPRHKRVEFVEPESPMRFEVSGIGGIYPEDNIAIRVTRQYKSAARGAPLKKTRRSTKLDQVLPRTSRNMNKVDTIISTQRIDLPPSELPPASYAMGDDESDMGSGSEDGYESSPTNEPVSLTTHLPTLAPAAPPSSQPSDSSDEDMSDSEDGDDEQSPENDDDQSLDFLATARAFDPESIRLKEREYDAEMAERLAEEIPAGSSAATAGGGSGFNSPDVPMQEVAQMAKKDAADALSDQPEYGSVSS